MISVEQASNEILSCVDALEAEERPILDSVGQVLAEDVYAGINVPPLDNSAMDGYAVQSRDIRVASRESPRFLCVIDSLAAGSIARREVEPGTAIRIMTGAPIPKNADCVVKFEDTDETSRQGNPADIGILKEVETGANIRKAGEDIAKASTALSKGTVIRPPEVGVLASLGCNKVKVIRRPTVAILSTGDELVDIAQPLPPGKIYNSNTYSSAALVRHYGGIPRILGIAQDNEDSLVDKLHQGLGVDMMVISGGVSVGDYDLVKDVLPEHGNFALWIVQSKPGQHLAFGTIKDLNRVGITRNIPIIALPGNPVSCMVTCELFVRPAILKMMGRKNLANRTVEAVMEDPELNTARRRIFDRVIVRKHNGQYFAKLTGPQGSGILTSMSLANGLAIIPEDKEGVKKGDVVQVVMFDWGGEQDHI